MQWEKKNLYVTFGQPIWCCWQTILGRMEIIEVLLAEVLNVCWSYQPGLHSSYISEQLCNPHRSDRHIWSRCGPHVAKYFQQPLVQPQSSPGFHDRNKGRASVVAVTCSVFHVFNSDDTLDDTYKPHNVHQTLVFTGILTPLWCHFNHSALRFITAAGYSTPSFHFGLLYR